MMQTLAGRKILSAPVVGPPDGVDPCTFTTNTAGQDVVCFVDIRDVCPSPFGSNTLKSGKQCIASTLSEWHGNIYNPVTPI